MALGSCPQATVGDSMSMWSLRSPGPGRVLPSLLLPLEPPSRTGQGKPVPAQSIMPKHHPAPREREPPSLPQPPRVPFATRALPPSMALAALLPAWPAALGRGTQGSGRAWAAHGAPCAPLPRLAAWLGSWSPSPPQHSLALHRRGGPTGR